jgi:two-component system osmolarity sensor histidine kinase EnvZ
VSIRLPRFDSLFARLLLAQIALVLVLGLLIGALFYVERNVTVAVLYADRWAPQLARAAGLAAQPFAPVQVLSRTTAPTPARRISPNVPRFAALRRALAERGVPVDEVMLSFGAPDAVVWLHVVPVDRPPVWLGVAGNMVVPQWSKRTLLALVLGVLLVAGASWAFTRRLTRPLERLRARMQTHTPGQPSGAQPTHAVSPTSPEIAAIDAAYSDLLARLQRHERERAVLLAGVSHDLRSPLGRIRMAAELLPGTADVQTRKAAIVRNVAQADRLIESFLDFVRSGELAFDETVDLAAAARTVVAGFERPAEELSIEAPASLPWPRANRLLVERLLANLIDNALKHGRPPVRLIVGTESSRAWIDVVDAGDGMAPDLVNRLQEAFARGDNSRSTAGSGLGLAIVRQVAARLGGALSFERGNGRQRVRVTLRGPGASG